MNDSDCDVHIADDVIAAEPAHQVGEQNAEAVKKRDHGDGAAADGELGQLTREEYGVHDGDPAAGADQQPRHHQLD